MTKLETTRITRVEVITNNGREYIHWEDDNDIETSIQDEGRTLKVFVNKVEQEPATFETWEEWLGPEPPEEPKLSPIEQTKKDIETLQRKLRLLEYEETVRTDVEKAYRDCYNHYPITDMSMGEWDAATWTAFAKGYKAGKKSKENLK